MAVLFGGISLSHAGQLRDIWIKRPETTGHTPEPRRAPFRKRVIIREKCRPLPWNISRKYVMECAVRLRFFDMMVVAWPCEWSKRKWGFSILFWKHVNGQGVCKNILKYFLMVTYGSTLVITLCTRTTLSRPIPYTDLPQTQCNFYFLHI